MVDAVWENANLCCDRHTKYADTTLTERERAYQYCRHIYLDISTTVL